MEWWQAIHKRLQSKFITLQEENNHFHWADPRLETHGLEQGRGMAVNGLRFSIFFKIALILLLPPIILSCVWPTSLITRNCSIFLQVFYNFPCKFSVFILFVVLLCEARSRALELSQSDISYGFTLKSLWVRVEQFLKNLLIFEFIYTYFLMGMSLVKSTCWYLGCDKVLRKHLWAVPDFALSRILNAFAWTYIVYICLLSRLT